MRILVISESINVEDSSASKGRVALITNLHNAGFTIKVLHYSYKDIQLPNIDCELIKENKWSGYYFLSRIIRVFQRYSKNYINRQLERWFGFSFTHTNDTHTIAKAIAKAQHFAPDLILTLSKGGSFRPHRAMLQLPQLQSKWMAYIHDPYPFHFYPRPFNFVEQSYKHKEEFMRQITQKAQYLSFPSLLLKEWMESYFPAVADKSCIIPHQIKVATEQQPLPEFFEDNQFSLLHAGNLLQQRNPKFLIEGFLQFLAKNPQAKNEAKLYFVGSYKKQEHILSQFQNNPNIAISDYIEYKIVQAIEKKAAVNIILEAISEISPFLPGKFPNCVASDKPILVLGPYYSEVRRLLGKDYPYWSEANDVATIEANITTLYQLWKQNSHQYALNRPDLTHYCDEKSLKKVLDDLPIA
ncbi:UDP-glycosyltransferase [Flavobacterium sp.]|jgi:glycosyltransferase involved in cell wall biosynthesis|uniref:UDP-glycosyltransferase n=1 Tax=Flavobacterium sp. TaxID=239 RepID=UPI0037C114CC